MADNNGHIPDDDIEAPPIKVRFPPTEEEGMGKLIPVICQRCELQADIWISRSAPSPADGVYAKCPCKGKMCMNFGGMNVSARVRGPGVSSSKYGMRRAREITRKNEELATKQWDNHEPLSVVNPENVRNPTPDGPYDPNGRMAKKKVEKKIFTPPSS